MRPQKVNSLLPKASLRYGQGGFIHFLFCMKKIIATGLFLLCITISGLSQKLMPTIYDAEKIRAYADSFKGKPLSFLLSQIEPEIKTVFVETHRAHNAPSYFVFKFIDREEQKRYNMAQKRSLSILVYLKENFTWSKQGSAAQRWSKNDAEAYGSLTILRVGVVGESL